MEPLSPARDVDPEALPSGMKIGPWRITGPRGRGSFGAVYRAVHDEQPESGAVALKLAIYPRDARFERESTALSRIQHPGVPKLIDSGKWRHASRFLFPYLVMEWIGGESPYVWSSRRNPSSRQMLRLLAQGARALQATHAANVVHRDVKGDNMLVRPADDRLCLMDFGSSHYEGAERLTPPPLPPGTRLYNSPEVWDFDRHYGHLPYALYVARPSDDVFAFGVMAYRLVTDAYPPFADSRMPEGRCWLPGGGGPKPPRALNPRVDPRLSSLILRALSVKPEDRGTAEALARELETRAEQAGPEADLPLFEWETQPRSEWPSEEADTSLLLGHRPRRREQQEAHVAPQVQAPEKAAPEHPATRERIPLHQWWPVLVLMAAGVMALWPRGTVSVGSEHQAPGVRSSSETEERDGGSVAVGDGSLSSSYAPVKIFSGASAAEVIAVEVPPKPVPGQLKPDANGHCRKDYVAINGGCWLKTDVELENCQGVLVAYQGACYAHAFPPAREPTSTPSK